MPDLFNTPQQRGFFSVYTDCLIEKITAVIGYEALLADISYSIKAFENLGYKIQFTGYNDNMRN